MVNKMASKLTVNQHYVPKVLLRGFLIDGTNNVKVYDLHKMQDLNKERNIKSTCSADHFYDIDGKIECQILETIENDVGNTIKCLRSYNFDILKDEKIKRNLIMFTCVQMFRTISARELSLKLYNDLQMEQVKKIFEQNKELFGSVSDYGHFEYDGDDKRSIIQTIVVTAVLQSITMYDLKIHILVNKTNKEFILSDNPAVMYNWLYKNAPISIAGSPMAIGTQMFLPISKSICLCFYDSKVYKFGKFKKCIYSEINEQDVDWLNKLQIMNDSTKIIYSLDATKKILENFSYLHNNHLYTWVNNDDQYSVRKINKLKDKPLFFKLLKKANTDIVDYRESSKEWQRVLNNVILKPS